jgi:hypothetical protein
LFRVDFVRYWKVYGYEIVGAMNIKPNLPVNVLVRSAGWTPIASVLVDMLLFPGIAPNPGSAFLAETEALLIGDPSAVV